MDLNIVVTDENGDVLYDRTLYRDGSDIDAAYKIAELIESEWGAPANDEEMCGCNMHLADWNGLCEHCNDEEE